MKKRTLALILALCMCFSLVACGAKDDAPAKEETPKTDATTPTEPSGDEETIKIGVLIPLSGGSATSGTTMSYVADMIVDKINNEYGGIQNLGGKKIELIYGDTQSDSTVAAAEFERLVEAGCHMFVGGYNSGVAQSLSPLVIANDQIMIMTNAFANASFTTPNQDNVWHVSACAACESDDVIAVEEWKREALDGYDGTVYGYVYAANDYGQDAYDQLVATKDERGVKEIVAVPIEAGATDMSAALMKLKERDDVQYLSCSLPMSDAILFVRQCQQYDVTVPIFAGGSGFVWADILDQIGESSDYLYSGGSYFADWYRNSWDPDLAYEYNLACKEKLGWLPDENYACMWGDMWTVWDVLERTKSLDREDLKVALRETNITGEHMALLMVAQKSITLPESFYDPITDVTVYNQNPERITLWGMAKDGEYRIVWPEEYANPEYPPVYPVPSWSER